MRKIILIAAAVLLAAVLAWMNRAKIAGILHAPEHGLVLYGNVDDRQVNLAFQIPERIAKILPEEGSKVKKGELVGLLETVRLEQGLASAKAQVSAAEAAAGAAKAALDKARNGSRAEDIAMAQGAVEAVKARIKALESDYKRQVRLLKTETVSVQLEESAESQYFLYKAGLSVAESYLKKLVTGTRPEDIALAEAALRQAEANLAAASAAEKISGQRLADAKLYSPCDGIVRNRLLEPGEMASPSVPALAIAQSSPKWVRVHMPEPYLPAVKQGAPANVTFDGTKDVFAGWVGYISPAAEFTPKNVETPELRPALVYEYHVYVNDPEGVLKLGAPVTVTFPGVTVK